MKLGLLPGCCRRLAFWRRWHLIAVALAALLLSQLVRAADSPAQPPPPAPAEGLPDPVPIRRLLLPPGRLLDEIKGSDRGAFKQLPRTEFEDLVQRAARSGEALKKVPHLIQAQYRARLVEHDLVGTGEWKVLHPGDGPALLALTELSLAIRQPRFENRPALLGELDGKTLGLLLDKGGEQVVALDWSARGDQRPEGIAFDLQVPSCPVAALELNLPRDRAVSVSSDGCLLTGPLPAEAEDRRLWRLTFAGRSQLRFTVRPSDEQEPTPALVLAALTSNQKLTPDAVEAEFTFDLKVLHRSTRELRLECDPGLRPYRVSLGKPSEEALHTLEGWHFQPGAGGQGSALLTVPLPEPCQGGTLQVLALAPLGEPSKLSAWTSPGMRLQQAVPRGETLTLSIHPDIQLEDWQPGGFRLLQSKTENDGSLSLTLTGGGVSVGEVVPRPGGRIQVNGVEFRARELTWWQALPPRPGENHGRAQSSLTVQLTYEVLRGRLFQLPVALPPGWEVDRLQLAPADLLGGWSVRQEAGRSVLLVELRHLVGPPSSKTEGSPLRLMIWLRPAAVQTIPEPGAGRPLVVPFPDVVPLGVRTREGGLAIDADRNLYDVEVKTQAVAIPPDEEGPWGKQTPAYFFPYHGQTPAGTLSLQPRASHVRAHCTSAVGLTAERAAVVAHLTLLPEAGNSDTLDLYVSAPGAGPWEWKTSEGNNAVAKFERLPAVESTPLLAALLARQPLEAAAWIAALPGGAEALHGERWRLTLARPLREPVTLEGTCELQRGGNPPDDLRVEVPLLAVLGPSRMEGEVKLYLPGNTRIQVETTGLLPASGGRPGADNSRSPGAPSPWRVFRYGPPPVLLTLRGQAPAAELTPQPVIDRALLTLYADRDGRLLGQYRWALWNWPQHTLPLQLPAGSHPLAARVDGRWITDLGPLSRADETGTPGEAVLDLPVPASPAPHTYEVVYRIERPAWSLWTRLEAPEPGLPLPPLAFRRIWRLGPGVAPLDAARQQRLPGAPAPPDTLPAWQHQGEEVGLRLLQRLTRTPGHVDSWQNEQRQQLATAAASVVPAPGSNATLGATLERLVFDARDLGPVVVDAEALREAGIEAATPLPDAEPSRSASPFWDRLGLVHVPCRAAPLLTTQAQASAWRTARGTGETLSASLVQAITEATQQGHDSTGRFRTVIDWLRTEDTEAEPTDLGSPPARALPTTLGPGWTAWEPLAGADGEDTLLVGRVEVLSRLASTLAGAGVLLTVLVLLACWRARRRSRRLVLFLFWLGGAGLAYLWLPPPLQAVTWCPLVAGLLVALVAFLAWASQRTTTAPAVPAAGSQVPVMVLLGLLGALAWPARAAAPEPVSVYLLPGPPEAPDQLSVFAPLDLLHTLQTMSQRGSVSLSGAVPLAAEYRGTVVEDAAHFEATVTVHSFAENSDLVLPFAGVQLQEVLVGGAPVVPELITKKPEDKKPEDKKPEDKKPEENPSGYRLSLHGRGDQVVTLRFRVPLQQVGVERDLQFTAPRLLQSRLTLTVPPGARYLQALVKQGACTLEADGTRLTVDLGRVGSVPLHFHWRQENGANVAPALKVQELYLWDLGVSASTLTGVLQYSVTQGAATSLTVELPEHTEVRSVEVSSWARESSRPRLKSWRVLEGPHRLQLELQNPATSGVQVDLDLVPRRPLAPHTALPLPLPLGAEALGGYLAYRLHGLRAGLRSSFGVTSVKPEEFRQQCTAAKINAPAPVAYACFFGRKPGPPSLGLDLEVQPLRVEAVQDLAWTVRPQQVDLQASLRLTAREGDALSLVEWEVPETVTLTRLSGPEVRCWSRSGSRVQVWLQRALPTVEVQLSGWWLPPGGPSGKNISPLYTFDLPRFRVPGAVVQTTLVHLSAGTGLACAHRELHHISSWPDPRPPRPADQELSYFTRHPDYSGSFAVLPALARADVRVLTVAEVRERQLLFHAALDCRLPAGAPTRTLEVRLAHWDADEVRLVAPEGTQTQEYRDAAGRHWILDLPPSAAEHCLLHLSGSMAVEEAAAGLQLPEVSVPDAVQSQAWLAVAGPGLRVDDVHGLTAVATTLATRAPLVGLWPREAARLHGEDGGLWQVAAADWGGRLTPVSRSPAPAAVQVFLAEQTAAVTDGRRWVHEARYWLYHEASTDLHVELPPGATVLEATVDGRDSAPFQATSGDRSAWVPLPGGSGTRSVRLRWTFAREELTRPNLQAPRLPGVAQGPVIWTVQAPVGFTVEVMGTGSGARPAGRVGLDLRRAEAQLRLSVVLAGQVQGRGDSLAAQLLAAQRRFFRYCRLAEYGLATASPSEPEAQALASWLHELEEQNRSVAGVVPGLQEDALHQAGSSLMPSAPGRRPAEVLAVGQASVRRPELPEQGTPLYWQASGPEEREPELQLTALPEWQSWHALVGSLLLVVGLLSVLVLSRFGWGVRFVHVFWPEVLVVAALLGGYVTGLDLTAGLVVLLAVGGRLWLRTRRLLTWLWRPASDQPTQAAGAAS